MAAAVSVGCEAAAVALLHSEDDVERSVWVEVIKAAARERDHEMRQQAILNANFVLKGLFGKK
jgi:hypothetical protein